MASSLTAFANENVFHRQILQSLQLDFLGNAGMQSKASSEYQMRVTLFVSMAGLAAQIFVQTRGAYKRVCVTLDTKGIARTMLQQKLASEGIDPGRADGYLCGCLYMSGLRYAFKHISGGKEFPSMRSIIDWEKKQQESALPEVQVCRSCATPMCLPHVPIFLYIQ